jgi:hypothetical protein
MFQSFSTVIGVPDHPLIAAWLALLFLLFLALAAMHACRIFGGLVVILIREFKQEFLGIRRVLSQVKRELTTKVDE